MAEPLTNIIKPEEQWTLFLDRDGVVNKRLPGDYVRHIEQFEFIPGVAEAISIFNKIFHRIIIVTNQQGIGKGLMSTDQLVMVHNYMHEQLLQQGGKIDAVYFCPHLHSASCNCRKPGAAMFDQAVKDFPEIQNEYSIMAGDSPSDMLFGKNAGLYCVAIGDDPETIQLSDEHHSDLLQFAISLNDKNENLIV